MEKTLNNAVSEPESCQTHPVYLWKRVIPLPPASLMARVEAPTVENFLIVGDAWAQLVSHYTPKNATILDVRCGCGCAARALVNNHDIERYIGFDVIRENIDWCNHFIAPAWPNSEFHWFDGYSAVYNPGGSIRGADVAFPAESGTVDVVFAASVFAHLLESDAVRYLSEIARVLSARGVALLSIHIDVPGGSRFVGTEHRIDIEPEYFLELAANAGLQEHDRIDNVGGQQLFIFRLADPSGKSRGKTSCPTATPADFVPLPLPMFVPRRYRPGGLGNWSGHLPFAHDLVVSTRPELIVELGTHWGESYFTLCQSVADNGVSCLCYAVDHWLGEKHSGEYGEEVFEDVAAYNQRFYAHFSYLLRSNFDDAAPQFHDDSIDVLHIDGLHTYQHGKHDFETWLPKLKPGGTVLLHDICARHADFGIWRLWGEIKSEFRETFEFHHSWGLGVVRKPGGSENAFYRLLFQSSPSTKQWIRRYYSVYASHIDNLLQGPTNGSNNPSLRLELTAAQSERMMTAAELSHVATERNDLRRQLNATQALLQTNSVELSTARAELGAARSELSSTRDLYECELAIRRGMQDSLSWRATEPLRKLMATLRSGRPRQAR